jgi:hypothetical protein
MHFKRSNLRVAVSLLMLSSGLSCGTVCADQAQSPGKNGGDFSTQLNPTGKVPSGVILVKGAWFSASDGATPVPEGGQVANNVYSNPYFGLTYPLSRDWIKKYDGPPPSDTGYYVLAQAEPDDNLKGAVRGSVLITAADLFFTPTRANNTLELVNFSRNNLQAGYKVERAPQDVRFAGHSFVRFDYFSPVAELHWHVLATEVRCHIVQFVFTSRDVTLLDKLVQDASAVKLPAEAGLTEGVGGGEAPVCVKDYASPENVVERVDPIFTERRYNAIPVRVIIDKEGKVKHIHFLSAFPEQSKAITDALHQWKLKPYLRDGQPVEVETGIMFGRAPTPAPVPVHAAASTSAMAK